MTTPFTSFAFPATGRLTSRTMPTRLAETFNVKDFGAVGTGAHTLLSDRYGSLGAAQVDYPFATSLSQSVDWAAIQLAVKTMFASTYKGATVYLPEGIYYVTEGVDIGNYEIGGNFGNGRIIGATKWSSYITGTVDNDFIFFQEDGVSGVEEIAHLALVNGSGNIASGALRINFSSVQCNHVLFGGMINVLMSNNMYEAAFNHCIGAGGPVAVTGYNGVLGIAGAPASVRGWRTTAQFMACIMMHGSDNAILAGNGIENCAIAVALGFHVGWASHCTVAPDGGNPGSSILTIDGGGKLGSYGTFPEFGIGMTLFGKGLDLPAWASDPNVDLGVTITADNGSDGTLTGVGWAGTYRISGTYTISTPVPMWSRADAPLSPFVVEGLQTEGCQHILYLNHVSTGSVSAAGGSAPPGQCKDEFGNLGFMARAGFVIRKANAVTIKDCSPANGGNLAGIYFTPDAELLGVTVQDTFTNKREDNIVTATISNGSGGAGTVLNVTAFTSGSSLGIGMRVTGAGVDTVITGNSVTDGTLTGFNVAGTYRVADSLNISSETMTVHTGADWVLPTATASKAGLRIVNCTSILNAGDTCGLNDLAMTFTCLPGEAGANGNAQRVEGQRYDIVDGQKSGGGAAVFADIVVGGGSQHIEVRFDGTNWRRSG